MARLPLLGSLLLVLACSASDPRVDAIVLVVVDTLRADHLGSYGYERDTSPSLDAWSASGRLYERALATSPWTLPSMASLFTGQIPARHAAGEVVREEGASNVLMLDASVPTLAEILSEHGFVTGAIVNNVFLAPQFGLHRGFADYDFVWQSEETMRRADQVVRLALRWIDLHERERFFLVVHLMDPHMNYDAPEAFRGRFTQAGTSDKLDYPVHQLWPIRTGRLVLDDSDRAFVAAAYDEEIAFVDQELEHLRTGLEARGILRRGLVVLTSDHGEELFDHGGFEHGHALWQEIVHVPLLVWGAGVRPGREPAPVSLIDVTPTLLDAAGIAVPDGIEGTSLWPNLTGGDALPERMLSVDSPLWGPRRTAAIRWPHKFERVPELGRQRLVDLAADPGERENLGPKRPRIRERMRAELEAHLREARAKRGDTEPARIDPETETLLRSLGYIE
ncbi:MAG: sulfatase [Proteobacteria bacterium]|nr:sulfatase [Pseudomonadota bacterium]